MGDDWGKTIQPTPAEIKQVVVEEEPKRKTLEQLKTPLSELSNVCSLIYGSDGSAKSGLVLTYLKKMEKGQKMIYIDLDGGALPLLQKHYADRINDIIYINPIELGDHEIDYKATFANIEDAVYDAKETYQKDNIRAIVFDGLSSALTYAESQMRIEKNLTPEGGVQMAYWKIRNRYFLQVLEQIKSIPIARFFIAHEDFIADKESSSVKQKANQMMFQKILMKKVVDFETVKFKATIHKSKYDILLEDETFEIASVDKATKKFSFSADKVWDAIEK